MSWIQDIWDLLSTVVTLTKSAEQTSEEVKELRKDVHTLTLVVAKLESDLAHEKETSRLVLDAYKTDITHVKENLAAKFDVLTTRLDGKVIDFENRLLLPSVESGDQATMNEELREEEPVKQKKQTTGN